MVSFFEGFMCLVSKLNGENLLQDIYQILLHMPLSIKISLVISKPHQKIFTKEEVKLT